MRAKGLTGLAALTLFDIASAQVQAQPINTWTGWYFGANAGFRAAEFPGSAPFAQLPTYALSGLPNFSIGIAPFSFDSTHGVFGLHSGYNHHYLPNWLVGWESDINWGRGRRSLFITLSDLANNTVGSASFSATVRWSASLRGRFGYVEGPWLFYGTGGLSVIRATLSGQGGFSGGDQFDCNDGETCIFTVRSSWAYGRTRTLLGVIGGAGIERMSGNWILRVEYLYATYRGSNFGNASITSTYFDNYNCFCTITSTGSGPLRLDLTTHTLRFGLSYHLPP